MMIWEQLLKQRGNGIQHIPTAIVSEAVFMKNSVYGLILRLVSYGINTGLIEKEDIIYTQNRLLSLFHMDEPDDSCTCLTADNEDTLEEILSGLLDYAYEKGIIPENTVTYRDLFDVKLMASLVKRPSEVIREFWQNYSCSPKLATDSYYKFSCDTDYIRRYRIKKDLKWKTSTEYGDIDITVNLSKPEKDPKAIAAAKLQKQSGYPKCLLCKENEGYAGRVNHPARDNHRIIPLTIDGDNWFMQYSPYVYYNEHCIVFNGEHTPMVINDSTFRKLFDFISQFPHYIIGSNADLPIVGGSILTHEHFQGGRYSFALNRAEVERKFIVNGFDDVECGIVKWPMSVVRLTGKNKDSIISLSSHILKSWRAYTDADVGILPKQTVKFTTLSLRLLLQRMENLLLTSFSEIILQVKSILWEYFILMRICIILKKKISALLKLWDLQYCPQGLKMKWLF